MFPRSSPWAVLASALAAPVVFAQEVRVEATIHSRTGQYTARVYHQPYPPTSSERFTHYALLKQHADNQELVLDFVASDSGSFDHEPPFLYALGETDLVVFSRCYRGCNYTFFRLDGKPAPVAVEEYVLPDPDEHFGGRGDTYRFTEDGLIISRSIARAADAACCPSGGTLDITYVLAGDTFRIRGVTRSQ